MKFFNIIRNVSLILVLFFIAMMVYSAYNPSLRTGFKNYFCGTNELAQDSISMDTVEDFTENTVEETKQDTVEANQMPQERLPKLNEEKKYKIPVKGGFAYLQPAQIMYVRSGGPVTLTMGSQETIELNVTLTELEELLRKSTGACFFRIKSAIINCNYVTQLVKESNKIGDNYSYQFVVTMQNGDKINVSEEMANDFYEILDNLSI